MRISSTSLLAGMLLAVALPFAHAGTIEQALIFADPQMHIANGEVGGCGYRLKAMPQDFQTSKSVVILDSTFVLSSSGVGLLKGGAVQVGVLNGKASGKAVKTIDSFWLKAQSEKATTPLEGKVTPSETKGYVLYLVKGESLMKLYEAVNMKIPLTIGMRLRGEGIDRIYTGTVEMPKEAQAAVERCMAELIQRMTESLEKEQK